MFTISRAKLFKYRNFEPEIVLLCLLRYLGCSLSYRDLQEMMAERGIGIGLLSAPHHRASVRMGQVVATQYAVSSLGKAG